MPPRPGEVAVEAARRSLDAAERGARRLGIDRRAFLRSSIGTATTLAALAACSKESASSSGTTAGGPGSTAAGTFTVPTEATEDTTATTEALAPTSEAEVVVDVQTHFIEGDAGNFGSGFPQANCDEGGCFSIETWADLVLGASDTSVAVLSAIPVIGPMSIDKMERARELGEQLCGDGRVLLQGEAFPQLGEVQAVLDGMTAVREQHDIVAWKTYTHTGDGYSFDDERGEAFLAHVEAIGPPVVCVHKGFGADPADLGPAAAAHPGITFCVYHSGYEPGDADPVAGIDRFLASMTGAGLADGAPTGNVYAEIGSTWRLALGDPDRAGHVLGKLLAFFGPERILWGTDSIWYGSPQDQIDAFRTFEITPEAQERFGYPALTPEAKRRILGANAAELHGLDLTAVERPCEPDRAAAEEALGPLGGRTLGPVTRREVLSVWNREHPWFPLPTGSRG